MDNPARPFDWNRMRGFLETAEQGSLSAAAKVLGLTQPTLSRQVAALEDELGVLLFERVGRALHLTQAGRDLLEHVRPMGEAANRIAIVAAGQSTSIDGLVKITASDVISALVLPDVLVKIHAIAPLLQIEIVAANDIRDLLRREADIAIRHVRPEQPDLVARLVHEEAARFYASKGYIARHGKPKTITDLKNHDITGFGEPHAMVAYLNAVGAPITEANIKYSSENGLVSWAMAQAGLGIAPMSDQIAAQFPDMVIALTDSDPLNFPIWLVTHREIHTSPRIRLVFDILADHFSGKP